MYKDFIVAADTDFFTFERDGELKHIIAYKPTGLVCEVAEAGYYFLVNFKNNNSFEKAKESVIAEFDVDENNLDFDIKQLIDKCVEFGLIKKIK